MISFPVIKYFWVKPFQACQSFSNSIIVCFITLSLEHIVHTYACRCFCGLVSGGVTGKLAVRPLSLIRSCRCILLMISASSLVWGVLREEDGDTRLYVGGKAEQPDHISLDLGCNSVIEAMAIPNGQLINPANRQYNARDLVSQFELLADESQDEVLPDLVGVAFGELEAE